MDTPRSIRRRHWLASALASGASGAFSQPGASGTILLPTSAGSFLDAVGRRHATFLSEATRTQWLVENLPGASGVLAGRQLLARPADGRTLLWATSGLICNTPLLARPPLEFNPATDFVPVSIFLNTPFLLYTSANSPAGNLQELQKLGRSRAEPLTYMPIDLGSANHLAAETLFRRLGVRGTPVTYRNIAQAVLDIAEGRVDLGVTALNSAMPGVRAGRLKAIAILADKPSPAAPGVPTVEAQGFGSFDLKGWSGLFAAKGTPHAAVLEHERLVRTALAAPGQAEFLAELGQEIQVRDHAQSRVFIESELLRNRTLLQDLKLI